MELVEKLSKKEIIELLGKCWMTHEAMWFYHCVSNFGIKKVNEINRAAMGSLVPIEMERFKKAYGFEKERFETFDELQRFLEATAEFLVPDFMNVSFSFPEKNKLHWEFNEKKCFAYNGVMMLGEIEDYVCGPLYRIKCWLDYLDIKHEFTPQFGKCLMHTTGACKGDITLHL
jgi:hypothetical protein